MQAITCLTEPMLPEHYLFDVSIVFYSLGDDTPVPLLAPLQKNKQYLANKFREEILEWLCTMYGSEEALKKTETATRGQASSSKWHDCRKGVVTASIAHSCFTRTTTFLRSDASGNIQPFLNLVLRASSVFTPANESSCGKRA